MRRLRSKDRRATRPWLAAAALAATASLVGSGGCGERAAPSRARPLVMVTVPPQRTFVRRLAPGWVDVEVMLPPGASPALYEPTLGQLRDLQAASLYVKVGHPAFPFERAQLDRLLSGRPDLPVVDGAAGVALRPGDPHYWLAPGPARAMARSIASGLSEAFPERAPSVMENLEALLSDVDSLDARLREVLAPRRGGRFFVFHPGWGYFADAYGLTQVAVEREHKSPAAHRVAELATEAREAHVRAIFVQPQFDSAAARVLAGEIGARVEVLDPLAEDWFDNMERAGRLLAEFAVP